LINDRNIIWLYRKRTTSMGRCLSSKFK